MTLKQLKNHLWLNSAIELPGMKTFFVREGDSEKLRSAKEALRELRDKQESRKQEQQEIAELRAELNRIKKDKQLARMKDFKPMEYFELAETLQKLKN
jgi:hypothetical protein